jgi:succinate dehydrogenase hydrophobic anchor subunit
VTILVHLVLTHWVAIGELSYDNIGERLAMTAVLVNDILLLVAVVYHALNGVRMVVLDYGFKGTGARAGLAVFLWVAGVIATIVGIWALWVWVS